MDRLGQGVDCVVVPGSCKDDRGFPGLAASSVPEVDEKQDANEKTQQSQRQADVETK